MLMGRIDEDKRQVGMVSALTSRSSSRSKAGLEGLIYPPLIKEPWQRLGTDKGRGQVWFSDQLLACQPITATGLKPPHWFSARTTSPHWEQGPKWHQTGKKKNQAELIQEDLDQLHRKHRHKGNDVTPADACQLDKNKAINNLSYQERSVSSSCRFFFFFACLFLPPTTCLILHVKKASD